MSVPSNSKTDYYHLSLNIHIIKKDITLMHTDAIVNAANENLQETGSVCKAVFQAAGSNELNAACRKISHCDTGNAVITPGFDLPARWIIHAVSPVWVDGNHNESKFLYSCYIRSFKLADAYHCSSIAFPLLSTGHNGFLPKYAWKTAILASHDYVSATLSPIRIYFCVIDDQTIETGKQILALYNSVNFNKTPFLFHDPDLEYGCFSNWYPCTFQIEGITYHSSEQYMMAKKALLFQDMNHYAKIMNANSPSLCQKYGRQVINYDQNAWDQAKYEIVYDAVKAKFEQNEDILRILLSTGDAILGEAARKDKVWGIGMHSDAKTSLEPDTWPGQNLLGKILMQVREELFSNICRQKNLSPLNLKCLLLPVIHKDSNFAIIRLDNAMFGMNLLDRYCDYHYQKLKGKSTDSLTQENILSLYSYFIHEIGIDTEFTKSQINSGYLEQLATRLRTLSDSPENL